jgi:membrane dipeptidase
MVGLTWNRRTPFGDGVGEIESDGGLSAMGRQLVDLLVERQIAIDLAHVSPRATDQVLERAGDGHLIASHVGCRALYDIPRNLTDDQLRAIGSKGGLVGVMPHPVAVGIDGGGPTLDKVVDHIDHMVDLVGADQVVIGSDFSRQLIRSGALHIPPDVIMPAGMELDAVVPGLAGPADMPALAKRMSERGYAPADLERILHGNLLAFLERVLDGHPSIADYGNGDG